MIFKDINQTFKRSSRIKRARTNAEVLAVDLT